MTLDILITTAGGWPYPKKCIESIIQHGKARTTPKTGPDAHKPVVLPYRRLPEGVRLLIRDNPASKKDETYAYLLSLLKEFGPERILLYSPEWAGEHGHNLDFLVSKSTAEWALAIDSDLEFTFDYWHAQLANFIARHTDMQCAVEMSAHNAKPDDRADLPGEGKVIRIWTPRATSWFMLFRPQFVREQGISFGRNDYEARPRFRDVYPYPPPKFMRDSNIQRWTMENGWQLLWAGLFANGIKEYSLVQIPPALRETYVHHNHKICSFMFSAGDKPNAPTNREHWGQDIPQLIP